MKLDIYENNNLLKELIIVDGYSGNGKQLISKFLQTFNRVEKMEVDHIFSEIGCLNYFNLMDDQAAVALINLKAETKLLNIILSREINFRYKDQSSIFKSSKLLQYIRRLFRNDGDNLIKYLNNDKPILHIMNHFSKPFMNIYFDTFKSKLNYFSCVRHPVYFYTQWEYIVKNIINQNPRFKFINFTEKNLKNKSISIPWFFYEAAKNEELIEDNISNIILKSYIWLEEKSDHSNQLLNSKYKNNYHEVCFENFILNTNYYIESFSKILNSKSTNGTKKLMKKELLPSKKLTDRNKYRLKSSYFQHRNRPITHENYMEKLKNIEKFADDKNFNIFLKLCLDYEKKHNIKNFINSSLY